MKILYLKDYKWLVPQTQRVKNDAFGYRQYEALTQHNKLFLKNIKVKERQCPDYLAEAYNIVEKRVKLITERR